MSIIQRNRGILKAERNTYYEKLNAAQEADKARAKALQDKENTRRAQKMEENDIFLQMLRIDTGSGLTARQIWNRIGREISFSEVVGNLRVAAFVTHNNGKGVRFKSRYEVLNRCRVTSEVRTKVTFSIPCDEFGNPEPGAQPEHKVAKTTVYHFKK